MINVENFIEYKAMNCPIANTKRAKSNYKYIYLKSREEKEKINGTKGEP